MKKRIIEILSGFYYSLPVQLLGLHLKKNQALLLFWLLLFAIITGNLGRSLGIPFLFLDPEYLNEVNFLSFFWIGLSIAGFSISFIITSYINDSTRFNFLASHTRPFSRFSLNNSLLPLALGLLYTWRIWEFQSEIQTPVSEILMHLAGLYTGITAMSIVMFTYFRLTNKDIFKYVVCKLDEKLRENVQGARATAMSRLKSARQRQIRVDYFLGFNLKPKKTDQSENFYDRSTILQVFDQNQFNLVSVEIAIFITLLILGLFSENQAFQIPAAASVVMLLTIFVMLTGAFTYWFRGWSVSLFIVLIIGINLLVKFEIIDKKYQAFGLNYSPPAVEYSLDEINRLADDKYIKADKDSTYLILQKWKEKTRQRKPKMVLISASGGGQRAMTWTLNALQTADSILQHSLMDQTMLITGASGGLIGAAFYRELYHKSLRDSMINPSSRNYLKNISRDNLNPVIFSLLVNDIFLGFQKFEYQGNRYTKDRGYSFEQAINNNTGGILDVPLNYYSTPEKESTIPMLIMAPTIINDGRKLYIGANNISYMGKSEIKNGFKVKGVDFKRFFVRKGGGDIRYLSALRMSATFPYVTPNISLPSSPPMEIMDAGLTDNFGVTDAIWFLYVFRDWIAANTSGVILLTIRDSQKNAPVDSRESTSLFQKLFSPIQGFYRNFENIQDINNDSKIEKAREWFDGSIYTVNLEYNSANNLELKERASLNWRLTDLEKQSIFQNIKSDKNTAEIERLVQLLK